MNKTNTTAAKIVARLARTADLRTARATLRAALSTEMGLSICHREVIREANAQLRTAGWLV